MASSRLRSCHARTALLPHRPHPQPGRAQGPHPPPARPAPRTAAVGGPGHRQRAGRHHRRDLRLHQLPPAGPGPARLRLRGPGPRRPRAALAGRAHADHLGQRGAARPARRRGLPRHHPPPAGGPPRAHPGPPRGRPRRRTAGPRLARRRPPRRLRGAPDPASAAELGREFTARAAELAARDDAGNPEAARVVVVTAALPVADRPARDAEAPEAPDAGPAQDGETP